MKICLAANTAWNLAHFRMNHMLALLDMGIEIHAVAPPDDYVGRLTEVGIKFHPWEIDRRSLNPAKELFAVRRIQKIYSNIRPDLVHHYTVKAVLYGTAAARWTGIPAIANSVTGLPYIIVSQSNRIDHRFRKWLSMRWYGWAVTGDDTHVILQNRDDLDLLSSFAPKVRDRYTITNGSGVDLKHFKFQPPVENSDRPVNLLFVGRFLREKGIYELMEAVKKLRDANLSFKLNLCGSIDHGNRSSATQQELDQWKREGLIDWSGRVEDVREELIKSDIVVLPSYREGTPRSLLEAMAVGRPLVTTDVPGCRNVIQDNVNGFMVPARTSDDLANAISKLIKSNKIRLEMGAESRKMAEERFDERLVIQQTLDAYRSLSDKMPPTQQWQSQPKPSRKPVSVS